MEKLESRIDPLRIFVDTLYEWEVHQISQYVSVTVDYRARRRFLTKIIDGITYTAEHVDWSRYDCETRVRLLSILRTCTNDSMDWRINPDDPSSVPEGIPVELADTIAADIALAGAYIQQMQAGKMGRRMDEW